MAKKGRPRTPAAAPAKASVARPAPIAIEGQSRGLTWPMMALQFALSAAAFRVMGLYRLMDADEGHFLAAIRCVYKGLSPSRDFFFQQTPLFPYPFAAAMKVFGYGYEPCMWVSVLSGAGLAVLVAAYFARYGGGAACGWIGWLLVMLNGPVLFWVPTVKNHALPMFAGMMALYAASMRCETKRGSFWWGALAGFAAMWSVGTRLPAAPLSAVAGLWILLRAVAPSRPAHAWMGVLGFVAGLLPPSLLVLRSVFPDPWVFYMNILGFHKVRSGSAGTYGTWGTVTAELGQLLRQMQYPLMLAVAVGVSAWRAASAARRSWIEPGLLLAALAWSVVTLAPAQTFHQYFMVPGIFLLLASVPIWSGLLRAGNRRAGAALMVLVLGVYATQMFNHREAVLNPAGGPPGKDGFPPEWSHAKVRELSAALAAATKPGDKVLTTWGGFSFFADRDEVKGNENFNGRTISVILPDDQLRRLHVATNAELTESVRRGEPAAIAVGFFNVAYYRYALYAVDPSGKGLTYHPEVVKRYKPIRTVGQHVVWQRR